MVFLGHQSFQSHQATYPTYSSCFKFLGKHILYLHIKDPGILFGPLAQEVGELQNCETATDPPKDGRGGEELQSDFRRPCIEDGKPDTLCREITTQRSGEEVEVTREYL